MNPLRYRGYCYDDETGLYYLNSRYYNPTWCRFISEDIAEIQSAVGDTVSGNLYAYCNNNPVMASDPDGHAGKLYYLRQIAYWVLKIAKTIFSYSIHWGVVYVGARYICAAAYWYLARLIALRVSCTVLEVAGAALNLVTISACIITITVIIYFYLPFMWYAIKDDIKQIKYNVSCFKKSRWWF